MDWKPLRDRVIVRKAPGVKMVGGLFVPDTSQDLPTCGIVLAVGPEMANSIQVGDEVVFSPVGGMESPALGPGIGVFFPQEILAYRTPEPVEVEES